MENIESVANSEAINRNETIGSGFDSREDAEVFKEWLEKDISRINEFIEWDYDPKIHHLVVHDAPLGTC